MNIPKELKLQRHRFEFVRLWLALGWILVSVIVILSLWPKPQQFGGFKLGGILGHLIAYLTVMLWFANIYPLQNQRFLLGAAFIGMGVLLECLQGLSGYRKFEYADMLANGFGVIAGCSLAKTRLGLCLSYLDSLLTVFR